MFADDLLVCGNADVQEASTMAEIINQFCLASGQVPKLEQICYSFQQKSQSAGETGY